jgi:hypothetical protein
VRGQIGFCNTYAALLCIYARSALDIEVLQSAYFAALRLITINVRAVDNAVAAPAALNVIDLHLRGGESDEVCRIT